MADETPEERRQAQIAAREAAAIGGGANGGDPDAQAGGGAADPALRAVREAGGGEAEGFEQAEQQLIEHASHGDSQSAHVLLHDRGADEEAIAGSAYGEADGEQSSEREDEEPPSER